MLSTFPLVCSAVFRGVVLPFGGNVSRIISSSCGCWNSELMFINGEDLLAELVTRKVSSMPHWLSFWLTGSRWCCSSPTQWWWLGVCEPHVTKQDSRGAAEWLPGFAFPLRGWQQAALPPAQSYSWPPHRGTGAQTHKQCHSPRWNQRLCRCGDRSFLDCSRWFKWHVCPCPLFLKCP